MRVLNKDLNEVIDGFKVVANLMPDFKCRAILGMTETLDAISSVDIPGCNDVRDIGRKVLEKFRDKLYSKMTSKEIISKDSADNEVLIARTFIFDEEEFEECFLEMIEEYNL